MIFPRGEFCHTKLVARPKKDVDNGMFSILNFISESQTLVTVQSYFLKNISISLNSLITEIEIKKANEWATHFIGGRTHYS